MKIQNFFSASLALLGAALLPASGVAQPVTLNNGGSSVTFNLGNGTGAIGMNNWMVDADPGVNQLDQQWFWFSVNTGSGWSTAESIDQLGGFSDSVSGNSLNVFYQNSTMEVALQYTLTGSGGGSGGAVLSESVNVLNLSASSFSINFWQFGHFNLLQNSQNIVNIGGSTGAYSFVSQSTTVGGNGMQETLNDPYANYAEAGNPTTVMNDVAHGNQLNGSTSAGPGDEAWGLEWTDTDTAGNIWNVLQGENMSIQPVPEPASVALIAMGVGVFGLIRRAKRNN